MENNYYSYELKQIRKVSDHISDLISKLEDGEILGLTKEDVSILDNYKGLMKTYKKMYCARTRPLYYIDTPNQDCIDDKMVYFLEWLEKDVKNLGISIDIIQKFQNPKLTQEKLIEKQWQYAENLQVAIIRPPELQLNVDELIRLYSDLMEFGEKEEIEYSLLVLYDHFNGILEAYDNAKTVNDIIDEIDDIINRYYEQY